MRVANLNPQGLVFSILPVRLSTDPSYNPSLHYSLERIVSCVASGEWMVFLGEDADTPPYGHRFEQQHNHFVPDEQWISESLQICENSASQISKTADAAEASLNRIKSFPEGTVHPEEILVAQNRIRVLRAEIDTERDKANLFRARLNDLLSGKWKPIKVSP